MKNARHLLRRWLTHRLLPLHLALLTTLLCLPGLHGGFYVDDFFHRAALLTLPEFPELTRSPAEIFAFFGDRWDLNPGMEPWWMAEGLQLAFLRPIAGLTHWLDHQLWPNAPLLMHAQSLAWMALTIFCVTLLYRRIAATSPNAAGEDAPWVAGLAALAFAIDDAHGLPAVWLANRNLVLATFLGVLTLLAHHRWRSTGWRVGAWSAPILLLAAVLSAEAAVACGAYLLAYALFLDHGSGSERLRTLLPCASVGILWWGSYRWLGFGAGGSAMYVDPGSEPLRFAGAALERAPLLLWGQWGFPPADMRHVLSISAGRVLWMGAVAGLLILSALLIPLLRRDARARFWAFGMLLSLLPGCAALPTNRLLLYAGLGGSALMALFVVAAWQDASAARLWRWTARATSLFLVLVHFVLAPLGLLFTAKSMEGLSTVFAEVAATLPSDPRVRSQQAIVVNAPTVFLPGFAPVYQALEGHPVPRSTMTLATSLYPIEVERRDAATLLLRPHGGFLAAPGTAPPGQEPKPFDSFYMMQLMDAMFTDGRPFTVGQRLTHHSVDLEILEVSEDGRPATVAFTFPGGLEDPRWRWLCWEAGGGLIAWQPPAVGERTLLPGTSP